MRPPSAAPFLALPRGPWSEGGDIVEPAGGAPAGVDEFEVDRDSLESPRVSEPDVVAVPSQTHAAELAPLPAVPQLERLVRDDLGVESSLLVDRTWVEASMERLAAVEATWEPRRAPYFVPSIAPLSQWPLLDQRSSSPNLDDFSPTTRSVFAEQRSPTSPGQQMQFFRTPFVQVPDWPSIKDVSLPSSDSELASDSQLSGGEMAQERSREHQWWRVLADVITDTGLDIQHQGDCSSTSTRSGSPTRRRVEVPTSQTSTDTTCELKSRAHKSGNPTVESPAQTRASTPELDDDISTNEFRAYEQRWWRALADTVLDTDGFDGDPIGRFASGNPVV